MTSGLFSTNNNTGGCRHLVEDGISKDCEQKQMFLLPDFLERQDSFRALVDNDLPSDLSDLVWNDLFKDEDPSSFPDASDVTLHWKNPTDHCYLPADNDVAPLPKDKPSRCVAGAANDTVALEGRTTKKSQHLGIKKKQRMSYREQRDRNNMASKRCREMKKLEVVERQQLAETLARENEELKETVGRLERNVSLMKSTLIRQYREHLDMN